MLPAVAKVLMTPNPPELIPAVLVTAFCGFVVIGFGSRVRLKMLTNSARIWKFILSLIRKLRPKFAFSVGVRRPRKSL